MTINFRGVTNSGGIITATEKGIFTEHKIWLKPNNKQSKDHEILQPLLERFPLTKDGFFKIDISPEDTPIEDSYIGINEQYAKFDNLSQKDVSFVEHAKNYLKKLVNKPDDEFELEPSYLYDNKKIQEQSNCDLNAYNHEDKECLVEMMHRPEIVKDHAKNMIDLINQKLTESLSKDATI